MKKVLSLFLLAVLAVMPAQAGNKPVIGDLLDLSRDTRVDLIPPIVKEPPKQTQAGTIEIIQSFDYVQYSTAVQLSQNEINRLGIPSQLWYWFAEGEYRVNGCIVGYLFWSGGDRTTYIATKPVDCGSFTFMTAVVDADLKLQAVAGIANGYSLEKQRVYYKLYK